MREEIITVRPFKFIDYIEIKGHQSIGEHGILKIAGRIAPDKEEEYLSLFQEETWVDVDTGVYEGTMCHMFNGIILAADIEKTGGTCILTLELITGSYLMDRIPHIRSFQDKGIRYNAVLDTIMRSYTDKKCVMAVGTGQAVSGFLLQYQETDWAFARRLASHFGTDIFAGSIHKGVAMYFGELETAIVGEINTNEYAMVKRADNTYGYEVRLRELFHVGDWLRFNGNKVRVAQTDTQLEGNELYHTYFLALPKRVRGGKKYNTKCTGISLAGKVTAVEKDTIQMEIDKDENKEGAGKRWFPYATPYSTPDGTGWYCMPETGDRVRLRIPSENEEDAYVVNSVHIEPGNGTQRQNPEYKSFMNKQGKEILLTPDALVMTNNAGMSIEILDGEGIRIISNKNIVLAAEEAIEITSANSKLELYAKDEIALQQGDTQMCMDGGMRIDGARLNLN